MKSFVCVLAFAAVSSASVLPIKLTGFGSHKPQLRAVKQCDGHENDALQVLPGSTSPDEICMPGTSSMDLHSRINEDLPTDLTIQLDLKKLEPFPMKVPCLNGVGSCPYDICSIIDNMADTFCPSFPDSQPCGCPLLAGDMILDGLQIPVPDMGILGSMMEGKYEATATFYGASNPDNSLGCINLEFSLKRC